MTATCTIIVGADGTMCGAPAVISFTSRRSGETFHECADHAAGTIPAAADVTVGARVAVRHAGIDKVGTVITVARRRCTVRVPSRDASKIITVAVDAVRPV